MDPCYYFEQILKIPRMSGHEKKIADYLCDFALKHNLECHTDEIHNVIIKRKSNNNSAHTIILQAHTDMVCVSEAAYDFENKGICYYIQDGCYKAYGTSLGADDGIGCAIILAILANPNIKIPNIEALFTVSEETTMNGAKKLDYSKIKGNKLISLDGTSEGVIDVSCAGFTNLCVSQPITYFPCHKKTYLLKISGLLGGHSGTDIDKKRGNAIKIIGEILKDITDVQIISIKGGTRDNVIPSEGECLFMTDSIVKRPKKYYDEYPSINITIEKVKPLKEAMRLEDSKILINFINQLPQGVLSYYNDKTPKTSLNLGVIKTTYKLITIDISIRSSNKEEEKECVKKIFKLANHLDIKLVDSKPFFSFQGKKDLHNKLIDTYEQLYNKKVKLQHVHAGLEGGIFKQNLKDLDICVIAPNLYDIHTIKERVQIESINRVYNWLIRVLEKY